MNVPKFFTFQELVKDHERLCAEVEELKKQFEGHIHYSNDEALPNRRYPENKEWATSKPIK